MFPLPWKLATEIPSIIQEHGELEPLRIRLSSSVQSALSITNEMNRDKWPTIVTDLLQAIIIIDRHVCIVTWKHSLHSNMSIMIASGMIQSVSRNLLGSLLSVARRKNRILYRIKIDWHQLWPRSQNTGTLFFLGYLPFSCRPYKVCGKSSWAKHFIWRLLCQ